MRSPSDFLTGREAQLMEALWRLGPATAEQVRAELSDSPHDSTVRTLLRVLESKGYVEHETRGKSYVYRPAMPKEKAQRTAVRSFVARLFGGSAEDLVLRLLEDEQITPEQLEEIRLSRLASRRARRKKGGKP